jgi:hypothetical protein
MGCRDHYIDLMARVPQIAADLLQIPYKVTHPYPVVMIHGGNQTGTNFTFSRAPALDT